MSESLPRTILDQCQRLADRTALRRKEQGQWIDISWQNLGANIRAFGRGLLALGLEPGERVAVMAPNSPEWVYADLGSMSCGALSVPIYHTEGLDNVLHILRDSQSRFLFIHSPLMAQDLLARIGELPHLQRVIQFSYNFV